MTANSFEVTKSTPSVTLRLVIETIIKIPGPQHIHLPSISEEIQEAKTAFEMKFFQIPIIQPSSNLHDYLCFVMRDFLNCPAVCDEKGKFIYFEVKCPGSA